MHVKAERVTELFKEYANLQKENSRSYITECPLCQNSKKFYIFKHNGRATCHRPSCEFGKRPFHEWLALTAGIDSEDAKKMVINAIIVEQVQEILFNTIDFDTYENEEIDELPEIPAMPYPDVMQLPIDDPMSAEGLRYLESRGVSKELAEYYEITYSPWSRRVVLPIMQAGQCRGYQGRAIDKVDPSFRMRNNEGFRRDSLVMFYDSAKDAEELAVLEGPFDALKFHGHCGFIATMGKVITAKQVELIKNTKASRVYLGLDDDAALEINKLKMELDGVKDLYWLRTPQSCIERCMAQGKKADFGECTPDEIAEAKRDAESLFGGIRQLIMFIQPPQHKE